MTNFGRPGEVPVEPILAAVLKEVELGRTWSSIAKAAGYIYKNNKGDSTRLKRRLGIFPTMQVRGKFVSTTAMRYDTALRIIHAINRDPIDFGL